jgi:hypothetical protein
MWIAFSGLDLQFRRLGLLDFRLDFDICLRTRLSRRRVADYESDPVEGRISGQGVIHVYRREILRKLGKEQGFKLSQLLDARGNRGEVVICR